MTAQRLVWSAGVVVLVFALVAAFLVASVRRAGYDFHAYWLPDEFRYLPIVAILFVPFALAPYDIALPICLGLQLAIAAAVGVPLIRQLPAQEVFASPNPDARVTTQEEVTSSGRA